jgi:hypothetical protein
MPIIRKRLKGSSIIEVVTGLFIISLSIALTGVLFANVFDSSGRMLKQQAWFATNEWRSQVLLTGNIVSEEIDKGYYIINKESALVDETKGLWMINIEAFKPEGDILTSCKFFMEVDSEAQIEE